MEDNWVNLYTALKHKEFNQAKEIIESGVSINYRDNEGLTMCHICAYNGMNEALEWLLTNIPSIDLTLRDAHGISCVDLASGQTKATLEGYMNQHGIVIKALPVAEVPKETAKEGTGEEEAESSKEGIKDNHKESHNPLKHLFHKDHKDKDKDPHKEEHKEKEKDSPKSFFHKDQKDHKDKDKSKVSFRAGSPSPSSTPSPTSPINSPNHRPPTPPILVAASDPSLPIVTTTNTIALASNPLPPSTTTTTTNGSSTVDKNSTPSSSTPPAVTTIPPKAAPAPATTNGSSTANQNSTPSSSSTGKINNNFGFVMPPTAETNQNPKNPSPNSNNPSLPSKGFPHPRSVSFNLLHKLGNDDPLRHENEELKHKLKKRDEQIAQLTAQLQVELSQLKMKDQTIQSQENLLKERDLEFKRFQGSIAALVQDAEKVSKNAQSYAQKCEKSESKVRGKSIKVEE